MKQLIVPVVAALVTAGALAPSAAAQRSPSLTSARVRNAIVAAVQHDRAVYGGRTPVPGVLVAVWDGQGHSFIHGFGYANLATHRRLTANDHFRIGSNTKTFVVATILQLADEKKLALNDTVSRFHLGISVPNAGAITVRDLCDMRSGLFEMYDVPAIQRMLDNPKPRFDARTMVDLAGREKPYFAPGKGYHYSNTNYLILGLIIEKLTHHSVGYEIRKRLLIPFDLNNTSYPTTQAMPSPWAHGYGLDARRNWTDVSGIVPVDGMGAAGLMVSNANDMHRWIVAYVTGKTSSPANLAALRSCLPAGTGIGFGLALGCSAGWYGYTGGLPGYNTANYYYPARHLFVLVWSDVQANDPSPGVANAMLRDIATIFTPNHVPFATPAKGQRSGL